MADIEKFMNVSVDDIEKIMNVSKGDIEKVMGFEVPSGASWFGDRAVIAGYHRYGRESGTWYTNNIQYRSISGSSHSAKFGEFAAIGSDANVSVYRCSGLSGGGRGMFQGGDISINGGSSFPFEDKMWYITIASTGDASVGTDMPTFLYLGAYLQQGHYFSDKGGGSNGVTGIIMIDTQTGQSFYNTIASTAAAATGGTLQQTLSGNIGTGGGPTYMMVFETHDYPDGEDSVEYMSYSTPSNNAALWGDLSTYGQFRKSCSSSSRTITWGYYGDGNASPITDAMEYWNHSSTGNAAIFGNGIGPLCSTNSTSFAKYSGMAVSNNIRGERWSGWSITYTPSSGNCGYQGDMNIDYVTIDTLGNAADSGYNMSDLDSTGVDYTDHYGAGISG